MRTFAQLISMIGLVSMTACSTDDVSTTPPDTRNLYPLQDVAFAEYLIYRQVPGVVTNESGAATRFSLDVDRVASVTELSLSKTNSAVMELTMGGVVSAETKITNLDGIQHFVGLETLRITSNDVTALDLSSLTRLRNLEMNFNEVAALNLRNNVSLELIRYASSSQAQAEQRLARLDLSSNTGLRHLSIPNHDLSAIDLRANLSLDDTLDLSGNPGPDGDRMTGDIVVPAQVFNQVPAENRRGVVSDAEAPVQLSLVANTASINENGGEAKVRAMLNRTSTVSVSVSLELSGSAVIDVDYQIDRTMLVVEPGTTAAEATLTSLDDMDVEGLETITVRGSQVTNAQAAAVVVDLELIDNDGVLPLIINEVLYDPPNDLPGDANADGNRDPNEDEFVEIVNLSTDPVDISGFMFFDTSALEMNMPRHTVPAGTVLAANQAFVLFGGGAPVGAFGGAVVQVANGFEARINLNNTGDLLTVQNAAGASVLTFDVEPLSNNPNESYTRTPDLTGEFEQHNAVVDGVLFSPGTRADGSSF